MLVYNLFFFHLSFFLVLVLAFLYLQMKKTAGIRSIHPSLNSGSINHFAPHPMLTNGRKCRFHQNAGEFKPERIRNIAGWLPSSVFWWGQHVNISQDAFRFLGNDSQAEVLTRFPAWCNSPVIPDCYSIDTSLPSKDENSCTGLIAAERACCINYYSSPQLLHTSAQTNM